MGFFILNMTVSSILFLLIHSEKNPLSSVGATYPATNLLYHKPGQDDRPWGKWCLLSSILLLIFMETIQNQNFPGRIFFLYFFQLCFSFTFAFPKNGVSGLFCLQANKLIQKKFFKWCRAYVVAVGIFSHLHIDPPL